MGRGGGSGTCRQVLPCWRRCLADTEVVFRPLQHVLAVAKSFSSTNPRIVYIAYCVINYHVHECLSYFVYIKTKKCPPIMANFKTHLKVWSLYLSNCRMSCDSTLTGSRIDLRVPTTSTLWRALRVTVSPFRAGVKGAVCSPWRPRLQSV